MMAEFLRDLFAEGRVRAPAANDETPDSACAAALADAEDVRRREFPGRAPEYFPAAAAWAATRFYRACQALLDRDSTERDWDDWLDAPPPACDAPPSLHYSVDLIFRYLPELHRFAVQAASADPLVDRLRVWARRWPYSSVGMPEVVPESLAGVVDHAGLLQDYVDRIVARRDAARVRRAVAADASPDEVRVATTLRRSLGPHASRFPEFASLLAPSATAAAPALATTGSSDDA